MKSRTPDALSELTGEEKPQSPAESEDKKEFTRQLNKGMRRMDLASRRTVYIKDDLWRRLQLYHIYEKVSISKILEEAAEDYLAKHGKIPI